MNTSEIYKACGSIRVFGGVYAKDTFLQASKQKKLYVVNTDPSWSPGEHWFVVDHTQEPCVIFDSYGSKSPTSSSMFWQGALGTAYYFNDTLQGATTNVCGDYCVSYVFLRASGVPPQRCFALLRGLGHNTHARDHCVREMSVLFFGTFHSDGVHISPLLNQICKASFTVKK